MPRRADHGTHHPHPRSPIAFRNALVPARRGSTAPLPRHRSPSVPSRPPPGRSRWRGVSPLATRSAGQLTPESDSPRHGTGLRRRHRGGSRLGLARRGGTSLEDAELAGRAGGDRGRAGLDRAGELVDPAVGVGGADQPQLREVGVETREGLAVGAGALFVACEGQEAGDPSLFCLEPA